ncbi:sensor histidine kinase [Lentimicrobium sp. S6]|uniref:tetratricopeptide repeat-containing sensor histidine kinase n=1 Tax=Lentimicrobium sp. S6 TaxID=2735872 RepID=UPI001553E46F|nr:sensor histidine kinase [Lentimicrobium sp. S6]NPD44688.1 sensor histidine kinase [Lentimicrobium sp. S6]
MKKIIIQKRKWLILVSSFLISIFIIPVSNAVNTDSLELIVEDLSGEQKIKILSDLCYYLSYSDVEKSEKYGLQCLDLALNHGDSVLIANAYNDLSILYTLKSDYKKGLEYNIEAYKIRKNLNNPAQLLSSLSKLGVCYSELGEFEDATKYLLEAIEIVESNHWEERYFQVYDNLGGVFKEMNQYETALIYHQKAYDYALKSNNTRARYTILVNVAGAHRNLGNTKKSIDLHKEAEQGIKEAKDFRALALVYSNLASLYSMEHEFDKVLFYSRKSIDIYEELQNIDGLSLAHNNIALFYLENQLLNAENANDVENELELAQKYALECKSMPRQLQNYDAYFQFYLVLGNYEDAMNYKLRADSVSDQLFTLENNKMVEELKTQYESEKKEKELIQQESKIRQKNYQLIISLGVLLFIIIGAIENYRKFRYKRKKLQEEIQLKEELAEVKIKSQVQEERLRISRDLHDNIGSQLTFIISSLDMAQYVAQKEDVIVLGKKLNEIKEFSASTIAEFRDTIWALNKENITLKDLELKLTSFISKAKSLVPNISFQLDFLAKQELVLDSEKGIKVFRIMQESVNNAIKHSEADKIILSFIDIEEAIMIKIEDDGKGMDIDDLERKNGLAHMEVRAEKAGGNLRISSELNKGTQVCLTLPVQ